MLDTVSLAYEKVQKDVFKQLKEIRRTKTPTKKEASNDETEEKVINNQISEMLIDYLYDKLIRS